MCPEEIEILLDETEDYSFDPTSADTLSLDIADLRNEPGLQYPALLLSNVSFMDCLRVLDLQKRQSYREVDVWVELAGDAGFKHIGTIQLDSDLLLLLRFLRIHVTMYYSKDEVSLLDLNDTAVLEQFV